jgi:chromosome condensin MukBEF complex kleisin-like MukF subunit
MKNEIVHIVNQSFELETTESNFVAYLTERINYLIIHDFNKLIYILYIADINEEKLNKLLAENKKEDAGKIIAALFIQRQLEKIKSREDNKMNTTDFEEEDRW